MCSHGAETTLRWTRCSLERTRLMWTTVAAGVAQVASVAVAVVAVASAVVAAVVVVVVVVVAVAAVVAAAVTPVVASAVQSASVASAVAAAAAAAVAETVQSAAAGTAAGASPAERAAAAATAAAVRPASASVGTETSTTPWGRSSAAAPASQARHPQQQALQQGQLRSCCKRKSNNIMHNTNNGIRCCTLLCLLHCLTLLYVTMREDTFISKLTDLQVFPVAAKRFTYKNTTFTPTPLPFFMTYLQSFVLYLYLRCLPSDVSLPSGSSPEASETMPVKSGTLAGSLSACSCWC